MTDKLIMSDVFHPYVTHLEAILQSEVDQKNIPCAQLKTAIKYSLLNGGKRFRPLLVYLTGELFDMNTRSLDAIAAAVEMVHCYSLIHDDLPAMDDDDFRRGKPSCHIAFDEATAILAGDALSSWSIEVLLTRLSGITSANKIITLSQKLLSAMGPEGMISGQSLDLTILSRQSVTESELKQVHLLKTGRLIEASVIMVVELVELPADMKMSLEQFARHLGLVFQMQDDYLDRYAPSEKLGKMRSSDLENDKTTYADLYQQAELKQQIDDLFESCLKVIQPLSNKSDKLYCLIEKLQARIE